MKQRIKYFAENLHRKYSHLEEEVVNPENQPMSKEKQARRDRLVKRAPAKRAVVIKGPPGRLDTPKEAKYRFATYLTMRKKDKEE